MGDDTILVDTSDNVCTLTLNRPQVMNAVNLELIDSLQGALEQIGRNNAIRVVVLTGSGNNFCSGADLNLLWEAGDAPDSLNLLRQIKKLILQLRELPQPIVSRVRGVAYGFGANLALASDFVLAAHQARFCEVFVNINTVPDGGGIYFLPRLVGMARARELAMLGDEISGRRAADIGLIFRSVPDEELDQAVNQLAERLAEKETAAISLIKEGLDASGDMILSQVLEWEGAHQAVMLQTREHKSKLEQLLKMKAERKTGAN